MIDQVSEMLSCYHRGLQYTLMVTRRRSCGRGCKVFAQSKRHLLVPPPLPGAEAYLLFNNNGIFRFD